MAWGFLRTSFGAKASIFKFKHFVGVAYVEQVFDLSDPKAEKAAPLLGFPINNWIGQ